MEALYHETNKLLLDTQGCFQQLERSSGNDADLLEREIQARIDTVTSHCERLDILVQKVPFAKRHTTKTRIDQLKYDKQHLQAALRLLQNKRYKVEMENKEREDLLSRRFHKLNDEQETSIMIDHSIQHKNSLHNANKGVDDLLLSGNNILENLRDQRGTLKSAQRKLMDIGNTLGLSNTTMRYIEQRASQDKWVLFGGMFVTITVIVLIIIYIR